MLFPTTISLEDLKKSLTTASGLQAEELLPFKILTDANIYAAAGSCPSPAEVSRGGDPVVWASKRFHRCTDSNAATKQSIEVLPQLCWTTWWQRKLHYLITWRQSLSSDDPSQEVSRPTWPVRPSNSTSNNATPLSSRVKLRRMWLGYQVNTIVLLRKFKLVFVKYV